MATSSRGRQLLVAEDAFSDQDYNVNDTGESGLEATLEAMPGRPNIHCTFDDGPMQLVKGYESRPLTVFKDGLILLETFHKFFAHAEDFCITVAEPVARPEGLQEYQITTFSLYSAVSSGLTISDIEESLHKLSKNKVDDVLLKWIRQYAQNLGKVKYLWNKSQLALNSAANFARNNTGAALGTNNFVDQQGGRSTAGTATASGSSSQFQPLLHPAQLGPGAAATTGAGSAGGASVFSRAFQDVGESVHHYLESTDYDALEQLQEILQEQNLVTESLPVRTNNSANDHPSNKRRRWQMNRSSSSSNALSDLLMEEYEEELSTSDFDDDFPTELYYIRVDGNRAEEVKKLAFVNNFPLLEEYEYKLDKKAPDLDISMKPSTHIREYQEIALSKMFTTSTRARSGIIVLPCGAGKTCVGITACSTIKKRTLVLTSTAMAVSQWQQQFLQFSTIKKDDIFQFTADHKTAIKDVFEACVVISTYSMIGFSGRRGQDTRYIMNQIRAVEWGLLICDEVQVMPAKTFRQVALTVRSRCKLGLTATLVREDDLITDLQWLIGPKLYEANWHQLQDLGYLAKVQCVEVWCQMSERFYEEYLKKINERGKHATARLLFTCNPIKLCLAEFLIRFHEKRGDKILVFSDNTEILKTFAEAMKRYYIYGEVPNREREVILRKFKEDPAVGTLFLSKVGDNAIDLPSANVVIQINAHFASRRQEAQRLGRILRPKKITSATKSASDVNAYFYSLVSKDTQEMYYASKRQQYLVEQGYAYKIVDTLYEDAVVEQPDNAFIYKGAEAERKLLQHVLQKYQNLDEEIEMFVGDEGEDLNLTVSGQAAAQGTTQEAVLHTTQQQIEERVVNIADLTGANAGVFVDD
ncbi:unnamed protein product [Amoebophrya sp. A120]|nr:unnamed protein product [Amoebophrya sp. A120]|eukprot:GSA120T00010659001.1